MWGRFPSFSLPEYRRRVRDRRTTRFVEDGARGNCARAATNRAYLDRIGRTLLAQQLRARCRRNDQRRHLTEREQGKRRSILAAATDDHVQRRPAFAQRFTKLQVFIRMLGKSCS